MMSIFRRNFGSIWIGTSDTATEGKWISAATNKVITYKLWNKREPNGKRRENCGMMNSGNGKWNDLRCNARLNYICKKGKTAPGV